MCSERQGNNCDLSCTAIQLVWKDDIPGGAQNSAAQYSTVQYIAVHCSIVHYSSVHCITVQYSAAQCITVQYIAIQYSIWHHNV